MPEKQYFKKPDPKESVKFSLFILEIKEVLKTDQCIWKCSVHKMETEWNCILLSWIYVKYLTTGCCTSSHFKFIYVCNLLQLYLYVCNWAFAEQVVVSLKTKNINDLPYIHYSLLSTTFLRARKAVSKLIISS